MEIKIETGIPLPKKRKGGGRPRIYPFDGMSVGDSFRIPEGKYVSAAASASKFGKINNITFRSSPSEMRIWRVK